MAATTSSFLSGLSRAQLKPVYLIAGSEHLLVIEAADALRVRAKELGYLERDILDVEAQFDWNRLAQAGASMSLFSSLKLIDLRLPTGRPGKEGGAAISAFCKSPPADTILLISAYDWSGKHEGGWSKDIASVGEQVVAWPLKREEMPAWISERMAKRGLKPTRDVIALLAERVEGNLLAAAQEIDKLAMLDDGAQLDVARLEAQAIDDARFDAFRLTDAAIGGDAARALRIVAGLQAEGEEVIPLVGWILNQLRMLLRLSAPGANLAEGFNRERIWGPRQPAVRHALKAGSPAHWERCLAQAGLIDRIVKGRADGDAWREVERLIAAIAAPRHANALLPVLAH